MILYRYFISLNQKYKINDAFIILDILPLFAAYIVSFNSDLKAENIEFERI